MKHRFCLWGLILVNVFILVSCGKTKDIVFTKEQEMWIDSHSEIILSPDPNFAPFEFIDAKGEYSGIAADYIAYINRHSSLNIKILVLEDWDEVLNRMRKKEIDMIGALAKTDQRAEYMVFTEPYIDSVGVVIVDDQNNKELKLEDLNGKQVVTVKDYAMFDYLSKYYPKIELLGVESVESGLRAVSFGDAEAFAENLPTASYYLKKSGVTNLKISSEFDYDFSFRMGIRDDWGELKEILDSALEQIPSAEREIINNKWIQFNHRTSIMYKNIAYVVGGVLLLTIGVIIWNRSLHRKVKKQTSDLFQELELRKAIEAELKNLNESLENKVERRTYLLNQTNHELEKSMYELQMKQNELRKTNEQLEESIESINAMQKQLIQSEKMAALGNLVAGVAHEINTPLGVAITAVSHIETKTEDLVGMLEEGKLKKTNFKKYLKLIKQSSDMTMKNLSYAKDLIEKFKNVAVDQQSRTMRIFKLKDYVEDLMVSLYPEMKKYDIEVKVNGDSNLEMKSYPGAISQIFTNLVINSIKHGYDDSKKLNIEINMRRIDGYIRIDYKDDGKGVDKEILDKLFEPFFTTKRGFGGSGLGLNIVYNIIVDLLQGEILAFSDGKGKGLEFKIKLPEIEGN